MKKTASWSPCATATLAAGHVAGLPRHSRAAGGDWRHGPVWAGTAGGKPAAVETWDAITSRRNVREFTDRPLPPGSLDQILEAGRRAPSSQNWQPWDFVVVTGRDRLKQLAEVWRGAGHVAYSAATIALIAPAVTEQRKREVCQYDLGQVTMSIMLAAADLEIGSAHAAVADQRLARQLLGFPEDRFCAYLIALGYPAGRSLSPLYRPSRRPFEEVVHRERW